MTEPVKSSEEKSLDELHREVLHLQKKKLKLSIKKLEMEMTEKVNKSTQTEALYEESNYSPVYYQFP